MPTAQEWKEVKPQVERIYLRENLCLADTMATMGEAGFIATEKMYKAQLAKWKLGKNATREDWIAFARLYQSHAVDSATEVNVQIHHKVRRIQDLRRYLRSHEEEEGAFFLEATHSRVPIPRHIHVCNSDGSKTMIQSPSTPPNESDDAVLQEVTRSPMHQEVPCGSTGSTLIQQPNQADLRELDTVRSPATLMGPSRVEHPSLAGQCNQQIPDLSGSQYTATTKKDSQSLLNSDAEPLFTAPCQADGTLSFHQLSRLNSFQAVDVGDDLVMQQNIGQMPRRLVSHDTDAGANAKASPMEFSAQSRVGEPPDAGNAYMSACMMAGMLGAARKREKMAAFVGQASNHFRQIGTLSESIMAASLEAALKALGASNPVCLLLEWMAAAAARDKLQSCRIRTVELKEICDGFRQALGERHGHTIVAIYCLSFHLLLADKDFVQAEQNLQRLALISAEVFGISCVLTINILSTLSRAQHRQGKHLLALETISKSLSAAPLGLNHPHRLELLLRKALILRRLDRWSDTEELYWTVVRGRVATLGSHHKATLAVHESLMTTLQRNGTWESRKDEFHRLLAEPSVSVTEYENWWRRSSDAHLASRMRDPGSSDEEEYNERKRPSLSI